MMVSYGRIGLCTRPTVLGGQKEMMAPGHLIQPLAYGRHYAALGLLLILVVLIFF